MISFKLLNKHPKVGLPSLLSSIVDGLHPSLNLSLSTPTNSITAPRMLIINQVLRFLIKSYEREVEDNERRAPSDGSAVALASVVWAAATWKSPIHKATKTQLTDWAPGINFMIDLWQPITERGREKKRRNQTKELKALRSSRLL